MKDDPHELEDLPGMGHNEGPEMDSEAWEEQKRQRQELLKSSEQDLAARARKVLLVNLLQMVEDGTATAQDMNVLRALLKDNGMIMGDPLEDTPDGKPKAPQKLALPSFDDPDYDP